MMPDVPEPVCFPGILCVADALMRYLLTKTSAPSAADRLRYQEEYHEYERINPGSLQTGACRSQ